MTRFHFLREQQLALATKQFNARGATVDRCPECLLAARVCICRYTPDLHAGVDLVLLFHREELFKPTNTGRLLMDCLPRNTYGFCWNRTAPDVQLLDIINDPDRACFIVFPFDESLPQYEGRKCHRVLPESRKRLTFILLDGTWKQAGRMFHQAKWMRQVPSIALPDGLMRRYAVRKSHEEDYVSTFEAGVACLGLAGETNVVETLYDYFEVFNRHYVALRGCTPVEYGDAHRRLG